MTEAEWLAAKDPIAMLSALRAHWRGEEADLARLIHRYLLACSRAIWALLPMEGSRRGIEVAERYLEGHATRDELGNAEYQAEGAAFFLDPFEWDPEDRPCSKDYRTEVDPELKERLRQYNSERRVRVEPLVKQVEAIPAEEMRSIVRARAGEADSSPRQLLADAAYFVDLAIWYPMTGHREEFLQRYRRFLSPSLLRELAGNPFRPEEPRHERIR